MRRMLILVGVLALSLSGCQITVEDLTPFHLRKGGGETERPDPQPDPKPDPKPTGKDRIYTLGITGMD